MPKETRRQTPDELSRPGFKLLVRWTISDPLRHDRGLLRSRMARSPQAKRHWKIAMKISFENTYAALPDRFYARICPSAARAPELVKVNEGLARGLGLDPDWLRSPEGVEFLTGKQIAPTSDPIAMAYAGHQFGHFVPQLGDGRAVLLGEIVDPTGLRFDLHLKGAGRTPFSRSGDGQAALGPVMREYVVSEAMAALGIPTTRALAALTTGQLVYRERTLPGAVIVRVASSHIRVGTFQYFAARHDEEAVRLLADYVIDRHYPDAARADRPYRALLDMVIASQAKLVARWLTVGFIHGVMNTDNCAISGETIDYGPCAFMDTYDPAAVFSSIDRQGRYAYGNQPGMALWNLARFAETLLLLLDENRDAAIANIEEALDAFAPAFEAEYLSGFRRKLGLATEREEDSALIQGLLGAMARNQADFTLLFRRLSDAIGPQGHACARELFVNPQEFDEWAVTWRARLELEPPGADRRVAMDSVNPAYIPRNHGVEAMIRSAVDDGDFGPFEELLQVLARPFEARTEFARYEEPPRPEQRVLATFCGT